MENDEIVLLAQSDRKMNWSERSKTLLTYALKEYELRLRLEETYRQVDLLNELTKKTLGEE